MTAPVWIRRETILALHEQLLEAFGGVPGVRDEQSLASALQKPAERFAADQAPVFALAAGYCHHLISDRPFLNGNKRLGFAAAALFLELNGYRLRASEADAAIRTLAFAARAMDEHDYAGWLEAHSRRAADTSQKK